MVFYENTRFRFFAGNSDPWRVLRYFNSSRVLPGSNILRCKRVIALFGSKVLDAHII